MTPYKKSLLLLTEQISKEFFSEPRSSNVEKVAANLFSVFIKQVKENSDDQTMYMMLKILMAEAMMMRGVKENANTERNA
jgi:hypothetical protein